MPSVIWPRRGRNSRMKRLNWPLFLLVLLVLTIWPVHTALYAQNSESAPSWQLAPQIGSLLATGGWQSQSDDLLYTVDFSSAAQPFGPLVVYRASGADLRAVAPVIVVDRSYSPLMETPLAFPSPDGRFIALLSPAPGGTADNLDGAMLSLLSTGGAAPASVGALRASTASTASTSGIATYPGAQLLAQHAAMSGQVVWSANDSALYYESGSERVTALGTKGSTTQTLVTYEVEIHRVTLSGHVEDSVLWRYTSGDGTLRLIGLDRTGALILTLAHPHQPVAVLRLPATNGRNILPMLPTLPSTILALPPDILPGNVLSMESDGVSLLCERETAGQPGRTTLVTISLATHSISAASPLFATNRYGSALAPLARSANGTMLVMSQVVSIRGDLAAQGIAGIPAQERLVLVETSGARQMLQLPYGGQIIQAFWTPRLAPGQVHTVPLSMLSKLLAYRQRASNGPTQNATAQQQDEWMLEGHANLLFDGPKLPSMCYGLCSSPNGTPHVSAAILHGVAYTESDWHQFNASDFRIGGEPIGSPIESFDGGWGEYQQTWGMPPQCTASNNCRSDASRIQHDQSYNIGTGIQALINAWNATAGVASSSDPNDPYKANDWFFAVWAYNGSSGNNPVDVPSSQYTHWYPGASFNSIYQERVWYFADHPQSTTSGWTDNYVPSLGASLLPPQSDFSGTADSFVYCVTCTIPDWTSGSYDRDWVGYGAADSTTAGYFKAAFAQLGGESALGLPRDNGGGAAAHRWGNGWAQDLGGGSDQPGALLLADGAATVYWISGSVWTQYLVVDGGAQGCHGYPTSNLNSYTYPGLGSDTYKRQVFQHGYILWDVTTSTIAADVCL